jgi:hypothetical protein
MLEILVQEAPFRTIASRGASGFELDEIGFHLEEICKVNLTRPSTNLPFIQD